MRPAFVVLTGLLLAAPGPVRADPDRAAAVGKIFAAYDKRDSPGCAVGVVRAGRVELVRGYGMADLEHGVPITGKSVFDIGSTSKQFTAFSIALLAHDGKLSLDDDVRKHVPELHRHAQPVTIRQLLHHTSGVRDYTSLLPMAGHDIADLTTKEDALAILSRQKGLDFPPGSKWSYSNSGYFLLAVIVERVSGQSLATFAEQRIFAPLGMTSTHFHDDHTRIVKRRAMGYGPAEGGGFAIEMSDWEQVGDGSVFTTIEDLMRWDANFYDAKVGGAALLAELQTPGELAGPPRKVGGPRTLDYAMGLMIGKHRALRTVRHGGAWAGYRAELLRFPDQKLSVICLCNLGSTNPSGLSEAVAEVYLAEVMTTAEAAAGTTPAAAPPAPAPAAAVTLSEAEVAAAIGSYRGDDAQVLTLVACGGVLCLEVGGQELALVPVSPTRFQLAVAPHVSLTVEAAAGGRPRRLIVEEPGERGEFVAVLRVELTPAQLAVYAGSYGSAELDATYRLAVEGGALVVRLGSGEPWRLSPTVTDEFSGGSGVLRFTRDRRHRITGFALSAGRLQGLEFVRAR